MEREVLPLALPVARAGGDGRSQPDDSSPAVGESCSLESLLNSSSKTVMAGVMQLKGIFVPFGFCP